MATDNRDQQFERALARHLRNCSPDSACPDPETLAAYHDRTLSLDEMARWKEHMVSCARCQETLALIEQSEHVRAEEWEDEKVRATMEEAAATVAMRVAPAARARQEERPLPAHETVPKVTSIRRMVASRTLRWAAPLGAVAAAAIMWVGLHERDIRHSRVDDSIQVTRQQQTPPAPPAASQPTFESKAGEPQAKALSEESRGKKVAPPAHAVPAEPQDHLTANLPLAAANEFDYKQDKNRKDIGGVVAGGRIATLKPTSPPSPQSSPDLRGMAGGNAGAVMSDAEKQELKKKAPSPAHRAVASEPQPLTPQRSEGVTAEAVPQSPQVQSGAAESVEVQPEASKAASSGFAAGKGELLQAAVRDRRYIVTPDERQAWRVGDQGAILRTTNFGKTWKEQNSGVTVDLISGSAPSREVCWLIGKAGTILLTTDGGKHWKQLASPTSGDLGNIRATDASHATVWDTLRQKGYTTTDGGETWTPANQ